MSEAERSETIAHGASVDADPEVSINECQAMRYLAADGYTYKNIQLMLQVGSYAVQSHVTGRCGCPDVAEPVTAEPLLGDELRQARYDADYTQRDLADEIGVNNTTISKWERRKNETQHQRHAHALRNLFNTDTNGDDSR